MSCKVSRHLDLFCVGPQSFECDTLIGLNASRQACAIAPGINGVIGWVETALEVPGEGDVISVVPAGHVHLENDADPSGAVTTSDLFVTQLYLIDGRTVTKSAERGVFAIPWKALALAGDDVRLAVEPFWNES